jgi:hypothetical protein
MILTHIGYKHVGLPKICTSIMHFQLTHSCLMMTADLNGLLPVLILNHKAIAQSKQSP